MNVKRHGNNIEISTGEIDAGNYSYRRGGVI
jgi:hypothetical protein